MLQEFKKVSRIKLEKKKFKYMDYTITVRSVLDVFINKEDRVVAAHFGSEIKYGGNVVYDKVDASLRGRFHIFKKYDSFGEFLEPFERIMDKKGKSVADKHRDLLKKIFEES